MTVASQFASSQAGRGARALAPRSSCSSNSSTCRPPQAHRSLSRRDTHIIRGPAASKRRLVVRAAGSAKSDKVLTLPTILTLGRVAAIPAVLAAWYWQSSMSAVACCALFVVASLTDWLDGYLARKLNASSAFGAFLDPVADKLMVAATLVLLSTQPLVGGYFPGNVWLVPCLSFVIIAREITMSALREWAAAKGGDAHKAVAVNTLGKWKTASQMTSLALLLLAKDGGAGPLVEFAAAAGPVLLIVAAFLTIQSLYVYFTSGWKYLF